MINPCFPGVSLRKGCLIIGVVQIIVGLAECLFYILGLTVIASHSENGVGGIGEAQVKEVEEYFVIPFVNFDANDDQYNTSPDDIRSTMIIVFSIALAGSVVYAVIGCLLIYASRKGSVILLKSWAIIQFLITISGLLYMIVILSLGYASLMGLSLDCLVTCLQAYFCWVGYTLIMRLREEQSLSLSSSVRKNGERIDIAFPMDAFTKF